MARVKCERDWMPIAAPISVSQASESSPTSSTQVNGTGSTSSQSVIAPTKYRRITPTSRLMIARMISAVTVTFGTAERYRSMRVADLGLETFDLVPQGAVLALVGRPYLLLRHLLELLDLGFHHGHAERLQLRLGLGEIVDRLGRLADFFLRGARQVHDQLLLIGRKPVPDLEVHHRVGGPVIVIGERCVFRHVVDLQRLHVDD